MHRCAIAAILALSTVPLAADVRITSTTTVEGALAAAMGGVTPRLTMQIKGSKSRSGVDVGGESLGSITDLSARQFILLNGAQKTARILTPDSQPASEALPLKFPDIASSLKPTGRSRTIAGVPCEEFTMAMTMSLAEVADSGQVPPPVAAMLGNITVALNGSMWIAKSGPGVAEFIAFQAAAAKADMSKLMDQVFGTGSSALDRLMNIFATAAGIPYRSEVTITVGGNEQLAEVLRAKGPMKVTTEVTEVSTAAIPDEMFTVPAGYEVIK